MANPFTKAWKYLMALFSSKVDEYADPKVQIQQAIEDAQRQHQALSQQAAAVIGNQRQLEMKLTRQMGEVEKLQASARQALVLADQAAREGRRGEGAQRYEQTAQVFATQLVAAEQSMEDLKSLHDQALQAAEQAKKAVERNAMMLQKKLAERTKLLSQLEQAKMQEQVGELAAADVGAVRAGQHPVARGGPRQDRAPLRQRARAGRARAELGRGPDARGAEVDARHGRPDRLDQIRASLRGTPVAGEVTAGQPAAAQPSSARPRRTRRSPARCSSPAPTERTPLPDAVHPLGWAASARSRSQRRDRAARARARAGERAPGPAGSAGTSTRSARTPRRPARRPRSGCRSAGSAARRARRPSAGAPRASSPGGRLLGPVLVAQQQLARQADGTGRVGTSRTGVHGDSPSRKHTSAL